MKRNDADPWCKELVEEIEIDGVKVTVRGLGVGELHKLNKDKKGEIETSLALVVACCERADGIEITEDSAAKFRPGVFKALSDSVARVNGFVSGNLNATGDDSSFSA